MDQDIEKYRLNDFTDYVILQKSSFENRLMNRLGDSIDTSR